MSPNALSTLISPQNSKIVASFSHWTALRWDVTPQQQLASHCFSQTPHNLKKEKEKRRAGSRRIHSAEKQIPDSRIWGSETGYRRRIRRQIARKQGILWRTESKSSPRKPGRSSAFFKILLWSAKDSPFVHLLLCHLYTYKRTLWNRPRWGYVLQSS